MEATGVDSSQTFWGFSCLSGESSNLFLQQQSSPHVQPLPARLLPMKVLERFSNPRGAVRLGAPPTRGHAGVLRAATVILDSGSPPTFTVF